MTEENNLNIKKRAAGLVAAAGLVGGLFAIGAPTANAVNLATCSGIQFLGTITPPLTGTAQPVIAALKTAKAGLVVWGPGFASSVTTTGAGSCTFTNPATATQTTFNDVLVGGKMSGSATCVQNSLDPNQYPLNGKIKFSYNTKLLSEQAYARVVGFDTSAGPDVIALTGIDVKGNIPGASLSGETFFDPVLKSLVGGEQGGPELKGQYYFDNSEIATPCGSSATAPTIGLIYGGDGFSLLGSSASGLSFDI